MSPATVLVMAKAPVPGRVKTRLCPPCTPEEAAAIAAASLAHTLRAAVAVDGARTVLALDGPVGPWLPPGVAVVRQCAGDLATRLGHACVARSGPTLVLGMDTPQVTAPDLDAVLTALHRPGTDAVLGPTLDGGWWTVAVHDPTRPLFRGVPMSTDHTGADQRRRLEALGLRVRLAPPQVDVDTFADARSVADRMPGTAFARAVGAVTATTPVSPAVTP